MAGPGGHDLLISVDFGDILFQVRAPGPHILT